MRRSSRSTAENPPGRDLDPMAFGPGARNRMACMIARRDPISKSALPSDCRSSGTVVLLADAVEVIV